MAAPRWFVQHLDELRRLPGSRPASAKILAEWSAQIGDAEAPSRPTISRWLSGSTLPQDFPPLKLLVEAVREHTRGPSRQARETLLRVPWWQEVWERAQAESGAASGVVYQGLDPFGHDDADRFFGRDTAIERLLARLDELRSSPGHALMLLLGQSGVGKSSLLAAGLLPVLERDGLPGDSSSAAQWATGLFNPGSRPLQALADALASLRAEQDQLEGTPGGVLVVDQFEEIFQADDAVQRRFVEELTALAARRSRPVPAAVTALGSSWADSSAGNEHSPAIVNSAAGNGVGGPSGADGLLVIVACRNDFFAELGRLPGLETALEAPFNLAPLTGGELTEAIQRPARQAGITVGNDLIGKLIADAGVDDGGTIEGQLPLISHVLHVMNTAGPMTVRAYERVGGIDGAVAHTATQAWAELQGSGLQRIALAMLVRLVRVGDHSRHDARQELPREELIALGDGGQTERTLEILSAARLVTAGQDTVKITHDALLRAWQRLRDAIDDERTDHVLRQNIEVRARQWDEAGRPPEQLLRGTVLSTAHRVAAAGGTAGAINDLAQRFLQAADEQEQANATRRRRLLIAAVVAVVLIVAAGAVAVIEGVAEHQVGQRAVIAEVMAQAKDLEQTDPSLAAQLYLTAYRMQPDPGLYTTLLSTENQPLAQPLSGHHGIIRAVAQAGPSIASGGDDGTIRIWAAGAGGTDPNPVVLREPGRVGSLAADPARGLVISSDDDALPGQSALRVWNVADPHHPVAITPELPSGAGHVNGLATSTDGQLLVATASDGTARLFNLADPRHPSDLGPRLPGVTRSVYGSGSVISPDRQTLAVAGDQGTVRLWNIADPVHPAATTPLPSGTPLTHAVAFSPTNPKLLASGGNSALRLWDTTDPATPRLLSQPATAPGSSVLAAAVSPDGATLAAASSDNSITLWNITNPSRPLPLGRPLTGSTRGVGAVTFSPDGHRLVAGEADGTVRVWSLPGTRLSTATGNITQVAISHHGGILAAADGGDDSVRLWDTSDTSSPAPVGPPLPQGPPGRYPAFHVAFSPDDNMLITGGGPTVRLWNIRNPRQPVPLGAGLQMPDDVGGLDLSPDGRTLAVGSADGTTQLFSLADPAHPLPLNVTLPSTPNKLIGSVHFSPDGRTLATAGADHQARLWDTSDPTRAHLLAAPLSAHTDEIYELAFSPDGRQLATVAADHTTRIWDLSDRAHPRALGVPLVEQAGAVGGVSWSPDGHTLATGSDDRTVALWNMTDPGHGAAIGDPITGHTDSVYSVAFSPNSRMFASGGRDRTIMVWHPDVDAAARRICAATPDTLTPQAWNAYVSPDRSYDPPCPAPDDAGSQ